MQNGGSRPNPSRACRPKIDDSERIVNILNSMGVNDFDNRVVQMLREILHRFNVDVFKEAVWAAHQRLGTKPDEEKTNPTVELDDLKLALEMKVQHAQEYAQRPDAEKLEEWAKAKNACPLPNIPNRPGIPLPQERFCLNAPNFQIVAPSEMDKDRGRRSLASEPVPPAQAGLAAGEAGSNVKRRKLWNEKSSSTLEEWANKSGKGFNFKWL